MQLQDTFLYCLITQGEKYSRDVFGIFPITKLLYIYSQRLNHFLQTSLIVHNRIKSREDHEDLFFFSCLFLYLTSSCDQFVDPRSENLQAKWQNKRKKSLLQDNAIQRTTLIVAKTESTTPLTSAHQGCLAVQKLSLQSTALRRAETEAHPPSATASTTPTTPRSWLCQPDGSTTCGGVSRTLPYMEMAGVSMPWLWMSAIQLRAAILSMIISPLVLITLLMLPKLFGRP